MKWRVLGTRCAASEPFISGVRWPMNSTRELMASDDTQGSEDLHREVYARFGLTYYYSEVLHRGLCNLLTVLTFRGPEDITRPRFEEVMAEVFSLTLGQLRTRLQPHLSSLLLSELDACLEKRNFLAHHFWFEKCHLMVSESADDMARFDRTGRSTDTGQFNDLGKIFRLILPESASPG